MNKVRRAFLPRLRLRLRLRLLALSCLPSLTSARACFDQFPHKQNGAVTDPRIGLICLRCARGQTWQATGSTGDGAASSHTEAVRQPL